tara:strand:+ start:35627 stop:35818 length:192 start_codon:yes stop_codon:yes gene_type:complete
MKLLTTVATALTHLAESSAIQSAAVSQNCLAGDESVDTDQAAVDAVESDAYYSSDMKFTVSPV